MKTQTWTMYYTNKVRGTTATFYGTCKILTHSYIRIIIQSLVLDDREDPVYQTIL